jgi:cytochrome c peroxidase
MALLRVVLTLGLPFLAASCAFPPSSWGSLGQVAEERDGEGETDDDDDGEGEAHEGEGEAHEGEGEAHEGEGEAHEGEGEAHEGEGDGDDDSLPTLHLPASPDEYDTPLPPHFQSDFVRNLDNTPVDNLLTNEGATLGRVLFYSTALSANGTVSCASCHQSSSGFTDPHRFSTGFDGQVGHRNGMSLTEARFVANGRFFWDERAPTLEAQVLQPIENPIEMGMTLAGAEDAIAAQPWAPELFEQAFGSPDIDADRISRALAQYVRAVVSHRSRFDDAMAATVTDATPQGNINAPFSEDGAGAFTAQENRGKDLFLRPAGAPGGGAGCAACHLDAGPPPPPPQPGMLPPARANQAVFLILRAVNNGLDATAGTWDDDVDDGVGDVTGRQGDFGRFKSPSLRNVEHTGPYMHDGRFATLDEVIDHYDHGVKAHPNLDPRLRAPDDTPRRLQLSADDKAALKAFLLTLTDRPLLEDERFTNPFH